MATRDDRPARPLVWEGRYQPFHRGHLSVVEELLRSSRTLTIVVVANEQSDQTDPAGRATPVPAFSRVVDEHHRAEKNPWPLWLRLAAVTETVAAAFPDSAIQVLGGRRLDLDWPLYDELLPPGRVFCVPVRDEFEDAKAQAWASLGQAVRRVEVPELTAISGTRVRSALQDGRDATAMLHPVTVDVLQRHGYAARGSEHAGHA